MVIKPPEVERICKNKGESPILSLNLIDPFIRREFDRKNKKKNGRYIGRIYKVSLLKTLAEIKIKR